MRTLKNLFSLLGSSKRRKIKTRKRKVKRRSYKMRGG